MSSEAEEIKWRHKLSDLALGQEEETAVLRVIRSRWLSMGPETEALEQEFARFLQAAGNGAAPPPQVLATANCTAALHLALLGCGVGAGDEVIIPSLSFVATANAVLYVGANPVFADIESPERPLLDPADVERRITAKTRAVIVMHYAGYPCAMDRFRAICAPRGIRVIEDAAHCAGSRFGDQACGTIGDVGCFSLFGNKNLPAGEGGFLVSRDAEILSRTRGLRSHGMTTLSWERSRGHASGYDVTGLGYNYRMPELSSAVARAQLAKLEGHNRRRDEIFELYLRHLKGARELVIPFRETSGTTPGSRHLFTVLVSDSEKRRHLEEKLREGGIQSSRHYQPITSFRLYQAEGAALPHTENYASRTLTLPFHPLLAAADVAEICDRVASGLRD